MYFDPTYILVLIGALISMVASINVNSTYRRFSTVMSMRGVRAEEAAQRILHDAGIYDVRIERIRGELTDHYSPSEKVLRLSDAVYGSTSVAAIGVAAHECGHAIQHKVGYVPLSLRALSVPVANIGSKLSWPLILIGLLIGYTPLAQIGVILFLAVVLFQLITLPVEFNASRRAKIELKKLELVDNKDTSGVKSMLFAAAMTYVASVASTLLQMLRMLLIILSSRRRDD